ncbi:MAG: ABC transporter ATP-binding protein [Solirubrobacteraceae bacterium]
MAALRACGIVKRFEETCALDGVDLAIQTGQVRGLLGPNGAGKTTLLRVLFGLVRPDAGTVELLDRSLEWPEAEALADVAGFVEDPSFYPYLSGRVNLELLAELDGRAASAKIEGALARVGLAGRGGDRVNGYSTGMKQRLGIAAALLREPRLLLLDEPSAGLDPAGARDMAALLRELADDGVTILLSSHQIVEVEEVCDSFTILRRGHVVWNGTADQLRAQAPASAYHMHTSDDARALELAGPQHGVRATTSHRGGLAVAVDLGALDSYVLALGSAGVAVRGLELLASPVESMFFALTGDSERPAIEPPELAELDRRALAGT